VANSLPSGTASLLVNGPTWTLQDEIGFDGNDDIVETAMANIKTVGGAIALWAHLEVFSQNKHLLFG
jgi:hypothetical protein